MKHRAWHVTLFVGAVVALVTAVQKAGPEAAQGAASAIDSGAYSVVADWLKPLAAGKGETGYGVAVDSPNRIFVSAGTEWTLPKPGTKPVEGAVGGGGRGRANTPPLPHHYVFVVDGNGKLIEEWKQWDSIFSEPHALQINPYDPEKHLWVVDNGVSQIFEFTNDGKKLLRTIGEKNVEKSDQAHFGKQSDMAFLPDSSFYVSDGYTNARVIKFDKNGKFLFEWGTKGSGPSQFFLPHDVAIDGQRRVYVADRGNNRIQVFDEKGKFLSEWKDVFAPNYMNFTDDGFVWVTQGQYGGPSGTPPVFHPFGAKTNHVSKYDLTGKLISSWGTYVGVSGAYPGALDDPHQIDVDAQGNIYIAETSQLEPAVQKFSPKANADRSKLIGKRMMIK